MAIRITAGKHRKRLVEAPEGRDVRPTSAMVRESIFNIVQHMEPPAGETSLLQGAPVADICCGCGTLGLEALSRGAGGVTFVDGSRKSLDYTKANIAHFGEEESAQLVRADATALPPARAQHHVVFIDPPYGKNLLPKIFRSLLSGGWVKQGSVLVAELATADETPELEAFPELTLEKNKTYGKTRILVLRVG